MEKSSSTSKSKTKKTKKQAKTKVLKKNKSNNGPTCSTFLAELKRKFTPKRKLEPDTPNVAQTIIEVLNKALPIKYSKKHVRKEIQSEFEEIPTASELPQIEPMDIPSANLPPEIPPSIIDIKPEPVECNIEVTMENTNKLDLTMPRMPIVNSEELKIAAINTRKLIVKEDMSTNTGTGRDIANEILKHVNTLRKISLIAEEFNQKNAKNLKEIVDSVQKDLIKKLDEIESEQKATKIQEQIQEATTSSV